MMSATSFVRTRARRGTVRSLVTAALAMALIPAAASAPARAAAKPAAIANPVLTLQLLGLEVVEHDGFIAAGGPADAVRTAAALFALTGDYALFTGPNETGTGYLALTDNNPLEWVELQVPATTIGSIINNTTDEVGFYTVSGTEGTRVDEVPPETTENTPASSAALAVRSNDSSAEGAAVGSPGVVSGNVIQVPIQIPLNICGNAIDIVGLLNPTFGNTCVNS